MLDAFMKIEKSFWCSIQEDDWLMVGGGDGSGGNILSRPFGLSALKRDSFI